MTTQEALLQAQEWIKRMVELDRRFVEASDKPITEETLAEKAAIIEDMKILNQEVQEANKQRYDQEGTTGERGDLCSQ